MEAEIPRSFQCYGKGHQDAADYAEPALPDADDQDSGKGCGRHGSHDRRYLRSQEANGHDRSHADGRKSLRRRYDTTETVHPVRKQSVDADTDDDCQGIGHPEQQGEPKSAAGQRHAEG